MEDYHRWKLRSLTEMLCDDCEDIIQPEVSADILEAIGKGDVSMVKDFLEKDGDVNGSHDGENLIYKACAEGQAEIVKLLLQNQSIHLNRKYLGVTALERAVRNGHMECMELLLSNPVPCYLELFNCWRSIAKFLNKKPQLPHKSAVHILKSATYQGHWDVIQPLLEMKTEFSKESFYPLLLLAVRNNRWDIVTSVFERSFYGKNELIIEVFCIVVNLRDWEKARDFLPLIGSNLNFDVDFVEAALLGNVSEVQRMLEEKQYCHETLNGNLLVVAAGGTNGTVAELLMNVKSVYTKRTFSIALYLTALREGAELLPKLLTNSEASYSFKDLDRVNDALKRRLSCYRKEGFLLPYFSRYLRKLHEII